MMTSDSHAYILELTDAELIALKTAVRMSIRKIEKNRRSILKTFKEDADTTHLDYKVGVLDGLYRKLGGDPEAIENREKVQ